MATPAAVSTGHWVATVSKGGREHRQDHRPYLDCDHRVNPSLTNTAKSIYKLRVKKIPLG
jgi:hypothetical protein